MLIQISECVVNNGSALRYLPVNTCQNYCLLRPIAEKSRNPLFHFPHYANFRSRSIKVYRLSGRPGATLLTEVTVKKALILFITGVLALTIVGCKDETPQQTGSTSQPQAAQPAAAGMTGTVVETMNSGGYTYIQFDTGTEKLWAAAPEFAVKAGDPVIVPEGMSMQNHTSKTLDRTFEQIYFVDAVMVGGAQAASASGGMPEGHPDPTAQTADADHSRPEIAKSAVDMSGLNKPANGKTVADIFAEQKALSGQMVTIRAKVAKFSPEIMGTNWLHLQDGTGAAGSNDLTITSAATAKVGDTVLVKGIVTTNKDFGFGYKYNVIIEKAEVTVE